MTTTTTAAASPLAYYGGLWRTVPREVGVLLLRYPVALVAFVVLFTVASLGFGTLVVIIGFFIVVGALYAARFFGAAELALLRWSGRPSLPKPDWRDASASTGLGGWLTATLGNGYYWLYLLHGVLNFALTVVTWALTVVWVSAILGGLTFPLWGWIDGSRGVSFDGPHVAIGIGAALFCAITLPFLSRGLTMAHFGLARLTLTPLRTEVLQRQVADLTESRGAAVSAEGHSLRRLERDIHDGPQQRLVRLQMDLAAADRALDTDPDAARTLITEATQQAKDALDELRALSRGFAPPLLADRGLVAALESLGDRSSVPVRVLSEIGDATLPSEIERNAYFVASEAVANAGKHAAASAVEIRVWLRVGDEGTWLDLTVTDDGSGGAAAVAGHGLAGLEERMRGIGGRLEVRSPAGGPTTVIANLPVTL